jgi:Na+/proline symporter
VSLFAALQTAPLPRAAQPVILATALVYGLVVAAIAIWASRRTRTARDFFVAGSGIGVWTLAIAAMAATLSGFTFIGGPGLVYRLGLGAVFIILPAAFTNTMAAWALAKRMRLLAEARSLMTVPDAIGARYRSRGAQGLAGISMLVAIVGYTATNALALGLVLDAVFGTGLTWGIWIGTAIMVAYTAAGGILAGVYTDVFQGAVMAAASLLVFYYALSSGGGLAEISRSVLASDPGFLAPWGELTPLAALSFFFVFGLGALAQPHVIHKFYMLRDPLRLKWYPAIMTLALMVTVLLYFGVGIAVKALVARGAMPPLARPDDATPAFLLSFTPVLLAGLVFAGVAAAIMSTVNSFMNVGAAVVTHDLPCALGKRLPNELRWGRISTVAIAVVAALVAQLSGTLVAFLGIFGWGLFASTLVPALAVGLNWPGATRAGAMASMTTGLVSTLALESMAYFRVYTFPAGVTISGLSLVLSLLVFFVVSLVTRRQADDVDADIRLVMDT